MYSCIINLNDHYCSIFLLQLSVVLVVPMKEPVLAQMFADVRTVILVQVVTYVSFIFFFFCRYYVVDLYSYDQYVIIVFFFTAVCSPPCLNGGTCTSSRTCSCILSQYQGSQCEIRKLVKKRNSTRGELAQEKHIMKPMFWNILIFKMTMTIKSTPKEKKQNKINRSQCKSLIREATLALNKPKKLSLCIVPGLWLIKFNTYN